MKRALKGSALRFRVLVIVVMNSSLQMHLHYLIKKNYHQVFFDKEVHGVFLPFNLEREFRKYLY